jgi:signal transduction histidine kinase
VLSQEKLKLKLLSKLIQEQTTSFASNENFEKAKLFLSENQWDSTLVYTAKTLNFTPANPKLADYCHFLRGLSFFEKKIFETAENEFLKISKDFDFISDTKAKLGSIALEQSNFQKALRYYKEIENIQQPKGETINIKNIKDNIGICYLHLKAYDKAEPYFIESVKMNEQLKDTLLLIASYGNLASFYYEQYKDNLAIPLYKKAYALAKTTDDFEAKRNTAVNLSIIEENRKDLAKALQYRKEYEQWKDSVNNQSKIYATAEAEKKIAVEKKEKEVAVLKADNEVKAAQRNTYLYSAIILLLMLGLSVYLYREKVKRNHIINAQKENLDELNATKDKLFSIVSHDLRSSVNAIKISNKKLLHTLEAEQLTKVNHLLQNNSAIVNNAYGLLDNLLNWALLQTEQTFFQVEEFQLALIVDHVAYNYKAMLADKEITFENSVTKDVHVYVDKESLKIVLRNLIDNAIKFSNAGDSIRIYTKNDTADFCHLVIEDTGMGMSETTRLELLKDTSLLAKKQHEDIIGTGLGMQLCKSMIQKNKGQFSIESELGKGTKMIVSLPQPPQNG